MDIFSILTLLGGLAFFLYGMSVMSGSLEKLAGSKLEVLLKKMTSNKLKSLALGAGITIAIQSSSAMTVMLVGLVNSGIMELGQTIGLIMGSNIGTTLTAWILSLAGLEGDVIWLKMLKPENFSLIFAFVGAAMIMAAKKQKKKDIGAIFVGFAILMYGMKLMSGAMSPLAEMPEFSNLLTAFQNPILGVLVGAIFTGIIQSSAASVGVLMALANTGSITFGMGIPIIMGQNIGTCVTALLSSIGANKNGKRVAIVHISFNLIGTVVCLAALLAVNGVVHLAFMSAPMTGFGVAFAHSAFNVLTTLMLLPASKLLERIAYRVVPREDAPAERNVPHIDENLFNAPSIAVGECTNLTVNMAYMAYSTVMGAIGLLDRFDKKKVEELVEAEDLIDIYEDKLGGYLVRLSGKDLTEEDNQKTSELLRDIGDFERIGDHAMNILESAQEIQDKGTHFSQAGQAEVKVLSSALEEVLSMTVNAFATGDEDLAMRVEPLEEVIDELVEEIRKNHIQRLQTGACTIELGFILTDLLTNMERISDHCANVASAIVEGNKAGFASHRYADDLKLTNSEVFESEYKLFREKYSLNKLA